MVRRSFWEAFRRVVTCATFTQGPRQYVIKRSMSPSRLGNGFGWHQESILFLGLEQDLISLARSLSSEGAEISFRSLYKLGDIYTVPLEQFTMVIMSSGSTQQDFDVIDVGGILKRAELDIKLVWASSVFSLSSFANEDMAAFCDVNLRLPAEAKDLEKLFDGVMPES